MMGESFYEASIKERLELYVEEIELEINKNEKLIRMYKSSDKKQIDVLKYFEERLGQLKKDFETTKRILKGL